MTPPRAMTPEEVELNCNAIFSETGGGSHRLHGTCLKCFRIYAENAAAQVAQARAEEWEACATVAADYCTCEKLHAGHVGYHAREIAAAIRARRDER